MRELCERFRITLVNSINPYRIEGQKTGAFEIVDDLGRAPDFHCIPVGNAGNITAYWKGYKEYHAARQCGLPKMLGFQAEGAAPIVRGHPDRGPAHARDGDQDREPRQLEERRGRARRVRRDH